MYSGMSYILCLGTLIHSVVVQTRWFLTLSYYWNPIIYVISLDHFYVFSFAIILWLHLANSRTTNMINPQSIDTFYHWAKRIEQLQHTVLIQESITSNETITRGVIIISKLPQSKPPFAPSTSKDTTLLWNSSNSPSEMYQLPLLRNIHHCIQYVTPTTPSRRDLRSRSFAWNIRSASTIDIQKCCP
jgi:hypothetical protein